MLGLNDIGSPCAQRPVRSSALPVMEGRRHALIATSRGVFVLFAWGSHGHVLRSRKGGKGLLEPGARPERRYSVRPAGAWARGLASRAQSHTTSYIHTSSSSLFAYQKTSWAFNCRPFPPTPLLSEPLCRVRGGRAMLTALFSQDLVQL